jgi:hypothetical protein
MAHANIIGLFFSTVKPKPKICQAKTGENVTIVVQQKGVGGSRGGSSAVENGFHDLFTLDVVQDNQRREYRVRTREERYGVKNDMAWTSI